MSKEVIAQYLADMEKDDFVFVHPAATSENAGAAKEGEGEAETAASEVDMAKVVTSSSWADEVEEEIMSAEDAKPGSWAAVAAASAPPKPTTGRSNWVLQRKLNYTELLTMVLFQKRAKKRL